MTLLYMALAWIAGLWLFSAPQFVAQFGLLPVAIWPALAVFFAVVAALNRRMPRTRLIALCLLAVTLAGWRYYSSQPALSLTNISRYNDQGQITIYGMVEDAPYLRDKSIRLRVHVDSVQRGATPVQPADGVILAYADRLGQFAYGDQVRVIGQPTTPAVFDTFSYRDYLARSGVYTVITRADVTVTSHNMGNPLLATLFDIRQRSKTLIEHLLPSPTSDFLAGILLGDDSGMSPDVREAFRRTGTSHLVAISGANIVIVAALLFGLWRRLLRPNWAVAFTALGLVMYGIFVGGGASVWRSIFMGIMLLLAERVGRDRDGLTSLAASVWLITALDPSGLADIGLQLSAMATLGLFLYAQPLSEKVLQALSKLFAANTAKTISSVVADWVLMTIAAQITTLPVILLNFREFSWVSFPVNILVAPAQAAIMSLGLLMLAVGMLWLPLGQLVAWLVGIPALYTLSIVRAVGNIAPVQPIELSVLTVALYYLILFGVTYALSSPKAAGRWWAHLRSILTTPALVTLGTATALVVWGMALSRPDGKLHVYFLGVGEGHAVLLRTPHGAYILIDGGENPTRLQTALGDRLPFYSHRLDAVVLASTNDKDIAALPSMLQRYQTDVMLTLPEVTALENIYPALRATASTARWVALQRGQTFEVDGVQFTVLTPIQQADVFSAEDKSMILQVRYGQTSFLLAPTVSADVMRDLMNHTPFLQHTVFELPSHGAGSVNSTALLEMVRPQIAVINVEPGGRFVQPDPEVLAYLSTTPTFRTDERGPIEIATDGHTLWVYTVRGSP